jgi:hypothetical protein
MDYEAAILYFICLEDLNRICRTNGPAPTVAIDNNSSLTSSVGISDIRKKQKTKIWSHYCDKKSHNTADCREIAKAQQHIKAQHGSKGFWEKRLYPFFLRRSTPLRNS